MEYCTQLPVHPRHPYAGDLVYTAFSGSHQDAIKKGLEALDGSPPRAGRPVAEMPWEAPYLPIDPHDVGRTYEAVIRVNSQSGKGGVAYILKSEHKLDLPRRLQIEFSRAVQQHTDDEGGEMSPDEIWQAFRAEYLDRETPLKLNSVHTSSAAGEKDALTVNVYVDGELRTLTGTGNGPIAAFVNALDELADDEHSRGSALFDRIERRAGARLQRARAVLRRRRDRRGLRRVRRRRPDPVGRRPRREHRHRLPQGRDLRRQPGLRGGPALYQGMRTSGTPHGDFTVGSAVFLRSVLHERRCADRPGTSHAGLDHRAVTWVTPWPLPRYVRTARRRRTHGREGDSRVPHRRSGRLLAAAAAAAVILVVLVPGPAYADLGDVVGVVQGTADQVTKGAVPPVRHTVERTAATAAHVERAATGDAARGVQHPTERAQPAPSNGSGCPRHPPLPRVRRPAEPPRLPPALRHITPPTAAGPPRTAPHPDVRLATARVCSASACRPRPRSRPGRGRSAADVGPCRAPGTGSLHWVADSQLPPGARPPASGSTSSEVRAWPALGGTGGLLAGLMPTGMALVLAGAVLLGRSRRRVRLREPVVP